MSTVQSAFTETFNRTTARNAAVPVALVGIVLLMVFPLPAFALDLLLAVSVALSVGLLFLAIQIQRPLDLSAFPTIILFGTLLRLALNVASTRLILLHGSDGPGAAGAVIRAFGEFLVGGNYVVGATIFILLVVINFVVITKGASRVAEVAARFALDALPGKQMAIDADVASGALTQEQARTRRKEVESESDFFGAMDGASKFVRGDAIAGLLITAINIVVGLIVGVVQHGMPLVDAASTYTLLTVGDGLASQIPALLFSTAAGVVVTRVSAGAALPPMLVQQLGGSSGSLAITSVFLAVVGLLPGMPAFPFLALAGGLFWAAQRARKLAAPAAEPSAATDAPRPPTERERLEGLLSVELLELEVGYDLVPLVDASSKGELVERIAGIRRGIASELGILVPSIHIRDNLRLAPNAYRLLLSGNPVGSGTLRVGRYLAMDPSGALAEIGGERVREPAFGLPARWITPNERDHAESLGYTVVDPATVAATHITELLRSVAHELLGRAEVQDLLDILARRDPRIVDEVIPNILSLGEFIGVLRALLKESVSIRGLRTILEVVADHGRTVKDPTQLAEFARERLARQITARFKSEDGRVAALVVDPRTEDLFRQGVDSATAQKFLSALDERAKSFAGLSTPPAILCAPDVRRAISQFVAKRIPGLSVLSFRELDATTSVRSLGVIAT